MPNGLAIDSNDPLTRRDEGLQFLDVTAQAHIAQINSDRKSGGNDQADVVKITNNSTSAIDTHLLIVVKGLSNKIRLAGASRYLAGLLRTPANSQELQRGLGRWLGRRWRHRGGAPSASVQCNRDKRLRSCHKQSFIFVNSASSMDVYIFCLERTSDVGAGCARRNECAETASPTTPSRPDSRGG